MLQDLLLAMGVLKYGPASEGVPLGIDTTGVIRRVGPNVRNVAVGDRIFALAPHGCITDRLVLPNSLAVKLPDDLTFEDAATMPCCFATAIYSLLNVGGMTKGQVCCFSALASTNSDLGSSASRLSRLRVSSH